MLESKVLITVGITCFKEGDLLLECWNSVLAQTDDRWEAVMVLDGTTDRRTQEIFQQIEHPKLRKFVLPINVGPYPVRNKAFELTRTPFHFYLDGDDQLVPDSVALVLQTFELHPQAAFVYGDFQYIGSRSDVAQHPSVVSPQDLVEYQPTPGSGAYAKSAWERLGGFASDLARGNADYDFCIGCFEAGLIGYHCGAVFYRYRVGNPGKVSESYDARYHETHEIIVRRHPQFFSDGALRRRFLAIGYRRAARANRKSGKRRTAARLAWAACRNGLWRDEEMQQTILEGVLPAWAYHALRGLWHLRKILLGTSRSLRAP